MNKRILLAEDDRNLGTLLRNYLAAKNYETTLFSTGRQALEAYSPGLFDLCILDIMMPEMDGISVAKTIRKADPAIPVIFLTAKNLEEDIIEGFKSGADDYITKPFSMEELLYRIEAILRRTAGTVAAKEEEICQIGEYVFDNKRQILTIGDDQINLQQRNRSFLSFSSNIKMRCSSATMPLKVSGLMIITSMPGAWMYT
jgi:DNA-binding response OmpR family regulator